MRVMATEGYDGATTAQIAQEAGLTPGLVHYHFSNKRAILLAMVGELMERHSGRLEAALVEAGGEAGARLSAFIDVHLAVGASADPDAVAAWVFVGSESLRSPEVRAAFAEALSGTTAKLREVLELGVSQGVFRPANPGAAAAALMALIQGYYSVAASARDLIPRGSAAPSARAMAAGLLGWTPQGSP